MKKLEEWVGTILVIASVIGGFYVAQYRIDRLEIDFRSLNERFFEHVARH